MAEALAVVGIVANIVQLVNFGSKVLERLEEYQSKLKDVPEAFRHINVELPVLLDALQRTKSMIDSGLMPCKTKDALGLAVEGCKTQIKLLDDVIGKALPASGDSWTTRSKKALRSLRYETTVEKITAVIRGYIQTLTYHAATTSSSQLSDTLADLRIPSPTPRSTVPFRRDPHFINRKVLAEIDYKSQQSACRTALVGLGGIGKSQIAIEYSYRVRDESPMTWVFWVHAGSQARFEEGYRRIATTVKMNGWDNAKVDILRLVRDWLCDESSGQWVMIIDNADDLSVFFPAENGIQAVGVGDSGQDGEPLSDFLPQSPNGSILITSRSRDVAYRLTGNHACIKDVKPMDEDEALALLQNDLDLGSNQDGAIELLRSLDYMPLAITQAAAYITQRAPRMTLPRYLDEIRRSDHDRTRLLKKDVGDGRRDGRASNSIIATWQISFEYIRNKMPNAARLLSLMSFFDRQGIPERLLQNRYAKAGDEEADFEDDIFTLTSYSLVEMNVDGSGFEMHRLVQFSTKQWLHLNQELEQWKATYAILMNDNYPLGEYENWAVCQELFPHVQAAEGAQPEDPVALEAWASLLYNAAWYASDIGQYDTALRLDSAALRAKEELLGPEHPKTLSSINSLGIVFRALGRYDEAEAMHTRGLEAKRKVLGPDHPATLASMANLAVTYRVHGKWREAEELEVQTLDVRKRVLGLEHPHTLTSMSNLAATYLGLGRWMEADELERQALETRTRLLGPDHPHTLFSMKNLASYHKSQGPSAGKEKLMLQVIETRKRLLGPDHPDTLDALGDLGYMYYEQGRFEEAEQLEVQVLEKRKKVLGANHPDTLDGMNNVAYTLRELGRIDEAVSLMEICIEGRKQAFGLQHPDVERTMAVLDSWKKEKEIEKQTEQETEKENKR